jgi:hypothetical protein
MSFIRVNDVNGGRLRSWTTAQNLEHFPKNSENYHHRTEYFPRTETFERSGNYRQSSRNSDRIPFVRRSPENFLPQRESDSGGGSSKMSTVR